MSATGASCCQLAKHVFKADKVITTVSTNKIPKVPELLGDGVVDQSKDNPGIYIYIHHSKKKETLVNKF